ncbi:mitochondrial methylglutaconyl-CoA hydratase [Blumeria hordei DH14]|uniref:Mitochondrial methylglutaconyl-CoA hydratase n=1 Tax=Blumeria graminis f. sp. hordei (strain DH14) TaxID=546991 RepID=N1J9T5_BLUG1|nr:mitochondrial methylglutaconyl-CoA hydratase [Blumeria hordei DH14]
MRLKNCPHPCRARSLSTFSRRLSSQLPTIKIQDVPAPNTGRIRILSLQLLNELTGAVDEIHAEYDENGHERPMSEWRANSTQTHVQGPTRALILTSESTLIPIAGYISTPRLTIANRTTAFLARLRQTFTSLSLLPIPSITAISGRALGGGLELALCTHLRVFASTAEVGLPETRLAIIPGAGGTYRLPALIGLARARDLILTGRRVSAAEAYFLGLADRLVEVEARDSLPATARSADLLARARPLVLHEAQKLAIEICEGGPVAVRSALKAVTWAQEEVEQEMYKRVLDTQDRNEALQAFVEKRRPIYSGK